MIEPLPLLGALGGGLFGLLADRLASRWPEHEEGVGRRGLDWRTLVMAAAGALLCAGLLARWPDPPALLVLLPFAAALLVLLATDIDQHLLPDLLTLPMVGYAALVLVAGWSPLLAGKELGLASGLLAGLGAPAVLFVSDRILHGGLGQGDLKLAISLGLLAGVTRLFVGFLLASLGFAVLLLALMLVRRVGLRTFVPFGPVLIGAACVAMLLP
jgi:leader peptidase (prepilin peptidase)/N-methyltransferase